jgi:alkenylglycerophosphocholine hydrolase
MQKPGIAAVTGLFFILASAFVVSLSVAPYPFDYLLKVSPIICLLVAVLMAGPSTYHRMIGAALIFCGTGDVSLELGYFTLGLGAFLIGHLFYLAALLGKPTYAVGRALAISAVAVFSAVMVNHLTPHLGDMATPVYLYMGVITLMAFAAITGPDNHPLVGLGAVLFVVSDSLIALNRFVEPIEGSRYAIMITYYAAQYFLTRDARQTEARPAAS